MTKSEDKNLQVNQDPTFKMMEMVVQKGGDIASLEKLMDLQERAERNQARKSFFMAFSAFQSDLPIINRGGTGNYGPYARIEDIADAIKPYLVKHGLCYRFEQVDSADSITVTCVVSHLDGHEVRTSMESGLDKSGNKQVIHQRASTVSYLRRYTLSGAFGIIVGGEDNDAGVDQDITEAVYVDVEKFNGDFPKYEKLILDKKKTASELIEFLAKKGAILSPDQKQSLKRVEGAVQ